MKAIPNLLYSLKFFIGSFFIFGMPGMLCAQLSVSITSTNVTCFGAANGQAQAKPAGGAQPYIYAWSNNKNTPSISNLSPGTYTVTVQDAFGNSATATANITEPTKLGVTLYGQSQLCDIAPDGFAAAIPDGGTPAYSYLWSNGGTTAQIDHLVAGTYTVTVTDFNGCTVSGFYLLNYWADGVFLITNSTLATCAYEDGTAKTEPYSGTGTYTYEWSNGASTQEIENLAPGTYSVTVTDLNGCVGHADVEIASTPASTLFAFQPTPLCLVEIASFTAPLPPPLYPQILWTLSDPLDQIISGQGTENIEVQWANVGNKHVVLQFGANGIFCGTIDFGLEVVVCADANEPWLVAATVSPNPFTDFLLLEFPEGLPGEVKAVLTDVSGKIVLEKRLSGAAYRLPTWDIPAGIYFLTIKSENGGRVWRVVKQ